MEERLKRQIDEVMSKIAKRRPGRKKLVYDRATKTILMVDQHDLNKQKVEGLNITPEEGRFFD